ncbi:unnamed protein product [Periconia digitata]|uniref:Uncharacterized protein n=1 Tax=Periconia digitata TaxID=1303443 RepID=A0A9W4UTQ0_9PLEO|nr:unnamed protein product [Periconia digitata]
MYRVFRISSTSSSAVLSSNHHREPHILVVRFLSARITSSLHDPLCMISVHRSSCDLRTQ